MDKPVYKAIINSSNEVFVDAAQEDFKVLKQTEEEIVVEINHQVYHLKIDQFDPQSKTYKIAVDHNSYEIVLKDGVDQLVEEMGLNEKAEENMLAIYAPMPGLVVDILVKEGDVVPAEQPLLILEAMKMENVIKTKSEVTIKEIHIGKNNTVEKAELLISFE